MQGGTIYPSSKLFFCLLQKKLLPQRKYANLSPSWQMDCHEKFIGSLKLQKITQKLFSSNGIFLLLLFVTHKVKCNSFNERFLLNLKLFTNVYHRFSALVNTDTS